MRSGPDEEELDAGIVAETAHGRGDRCKFVCAPEVAGVGDDEGVAESPLRPESAVLDWMQRRVCPVVPHDGGRATGADARGHLLAEGDVHRRAVQRPVAQRPRQPRRAHPQRRCDLGEEVLRPVDQPRAAQHAGECGDDGEQRRVGHRHDDVAAPRAPQQRKERAEVKGRVVERAPRQEAAPEARRGDAHDVDAVQPLPRREPRRGGVVALAARDGHDVMAPPGEKECEVANHLACCRMVGGEVTIRENDPHSPVLSAEF